MMASGVSNDPVSYDAFSVVNTEGRRLSVRGLPGRRIFGGMTATARQSVAYENAQASGVSNDPVSYDAFRVVNTEGRRLAVRGRPGRRNLKPHPKGEALNWCGLVKFPIIFLFFEKIVHLK